MQRPVWTLFATLTLALLAAAVCSRAGAASGLPPPEVRTSTSTSMSTSITTPAATRSAALVLQDHTALRGAARADAPVLSTLWRGEMLEVRADLGDYLQIWDHQRERGGYVRRGQVHSLAQAQANELLALLAFVQDQAGAETTSLALAAAAIQALSAAQLQGGAAATVLEAIGNAADRLAARASGPPPPRSADQAALSAHLELAARLGVRLDSVDSAGRVQLCYEGDAWRRLLALPANSVSAASRARAALALTRSDCQSPTSSVREREAADSQRARWLDSVRSEALPPQLGKRINTRRAAVWSSIAFVRARRGQAASAQAAAERALAELALVSKSELVDEDLQRYNEAALRVNAVRWAAAPALSQQDLTQTLGVSLQVTEDGQQCVLVTLLQRPDAAPLARRCTWGLPYLASARVSREGRAIALAVQSTEGWRELWLWRQEAGAGGWAVLPPTAGTPGLGYAEFAGWVPGGQHLLVAREAISENRHSRRFEVLRMDTLSVERTAFEPGTLGAFSRWQDPQWARDSLALR